MPPSANSFVCTLQCRNYLKVGSRSTGKLGGMEGRNDQKAGMTSKRVDNRWGDSSLPVYDLYDSFWSGIYQCSSKTRITLINNLLEDWRTACPTAQLHGVIGAKLKNKQKTLKNNVFKSHWSGPANKKLMKNISRHIKLYLSPMTGETFQPHSSFFSKTNEGCNRIYFLGKERQLEFRIF